MLRSLRLVGLAAGIALASLASAHHSQVGIFDSQKNVEVTGVIKSISWRNPHGQILLTSTNADGTTTEWDAETASIAVLRNRGAEPSAVVVGDRVTIAGAPSVRGRNEILARSMLLSSGYEFTFGGAQAYFPEGKSGRIVGRATIEADVAEATAKADGIFRVWSTIMSDPAAFPMFKGGYPLTAAGRAGLAQWNPRDNSLLKCGTKGTPLIMISPLPMEFTRVGDTIVMRLEEYDTVRALSENDSRANARPWPTSRTSRRFPRSPRRARPWPCPGTCPCTRESRPPPRL
jgi:hypothetical protein